MSLSTDLISQFISATNDEKKVSTETTVYGTVKKNGTNVYVQLDGSKVLTPATTEVNVEHDQRVSVLIKNHTATITGNVTDPSVGAEASKKEILRFDTAIGKSLTVDELTAATGFIDKLITNDITTENISAVTADIEELVAGTITTDELKAKWAQIDGLDAGLADIITANIGTAIVQKLTSSYAYIRRLEVDHGSFKTLTTERLNANDAVIKALEVNKLDANAVDAKFANIDFANVGEAAIRALFLKTGLIDDLVVGDDLKVSGNLVAVTIDGGRINAGTLTADRLLLKGDEDGLYYQLNLNALGEAYVTDLSPEEQQELQNGIHGENIIANSITAKHIVADDLTAFGATIADFNIIPASGMNLLTNETSENEVSNKNYSYRILELSDVDMLVSKGNYTISFDCDPLNEDIVCCLYVTKYDKKDGGLLCEFITEFEQAGDRMVGTGKCPELVEGESFAGQLQLYIINQKDNTAAVTTSRVKLELGSHATSWTPEPGKLYSDAKSSPENDTRGIYMDTDGQFAVGDGNNYLKFYKDEENEKYKLALKTSHIELDNGKTVEKTVEDAAIEVRNIGKNLFLNSGRLQNAKIQYSGADEYTIGSDSTAPSGNSAQCRWNNLDNHAVLDVFISSSNYNDKIKAGDTVTVSMYLKFSGKASIRPHCSCSFLDSTTVESCLPVLNSSWQRLVVTGIASRDTSSQVTESITPDMHLWTDDFTAEAGDVFYISSPKIELGDKATAWTWSTESDDTDIQNAVNSIDIGKSVSDGLQQISNDVNEHKEAIKIINSLLKGESPADQTYIDMGNIRTLVDEINGALSSLYIGSGDNRRECALFKQDSDGMVLSFGEAITDYVEDIREKTADAVSISSHIRLMRDGNGEACILITPSESQLGCKLKLTKDDIQFINSNDRIAAVITSDENDSLQTDNITIENEFRQSNPIYSTRNLLTSASEEKIESTGSGRQLEVHDPNQFISGDLYTLSFTGTLPSDADEWLLRVVVYDESGNAQILDFITDFKQVDGRWVGTGEYPELSAGLVYRQLRLYPMPYNTTHASAAITSHIKLESGKKATDWTMPPEEVVSNVSGITSGSFVWEVRANGNYGLSWKGD